MNYVAKHSKDQNTEDAREAFYADTEIWDHEFDDPNEANEADDDDEN